MDICDRQQYFLLGCISVRLVLAYLAYHLVSTKSEQLKYLLPITFAIGISFILINVFKLRETGFEAGGKIWWNDLRLFHGLLYLLFSITAYKGWEYSYYFLILDVCIGYIAFVKHHYALCKKE